MKEWKKNNWEKYWKKHWDKKWGDDKYKDKYVEMRRIMNKLGETQFKAEKLMMQLANKTNEEEFKNEASKIEKMIEKLSKSIDEECNKFK